MATSEKQDSVNVENFIAQAQASMTQQEREARETIQKQNNILEVLYLKKIREVALDGFRKGFKINIHRRKEPEEGAAISLRYKNPLTGKEEDDNMEWKSIPFRKQSLTTQEYNDFVAYRYKWLDEKNFGNQAVAEDMEHRLYEYGAKKFLGMNHNDYEYADKEQVRLAVDACTQITAWNGQFITREEFENAKLDEVAEENEGTTIQVPKFKIRDTTGEYSIKGGDDLLNTDD